MDYSKMTKQELIDKLNEQVHLAAAVEAKDLEIAKLNSLLETTKTNNLTEKANELKTVKDTNAKYLEKVMDYDRLQKENEEIKKSIKVLIDFANRYTGMTRSFMKIVQGGLENAVEYEALLSQMLKNGG